MQMSITVFESMDGATLMPNHQQYNMLCLCLLGPYLQV